MNAHVDRIRETIRQRAALFCCDNMDMIGKLHTIETAMLMGAMIVLETPIDLTDEVGGGLSDELLRELFEGPSAETETIVLP